MRRPSWPEQDMVPPHELHIYQAFLSTPATTIRRGTTSYLAKAVLDRLLQGDLNLAGVNRQSCSVISLGIMCIHDDYQE
ncbi:unnamed protein product [Protopolystoma xenopodis]|uniref:Uncharacterized protein n=1 Tax=Protopolystoma xenopodis TaxID=117903 RepID=A0A448WQ06_9PLAT|nr:unnamed protein product [Protopolystoma xenopodis]